MMMPIPEEFMGKNEYLPYIFQQSTQESYLKKLNQKVVEDSKRKGTDGAGSSMT